MISPSPIMFRNPHLRVRWAAINSIGRMCTNFGLQIQVEFQEPMVNSLIGVKDDAANPGVQRHTAAAVINLCDEATILIIAFYLNKPLQKLQALLQSPHKISQEQAVTAIAVVANSDETQFFKYCVWFRSRLKKVLSGATGQKHLRRL